MMQWASVSVSLSQGVRDGIAAISARLGTAATQHEMFSKLCDYSRRTFTYHPSGTNLSSALSMNLFNCETISDLTYLLWLFRNPGESHDVAREGVRHHRRASGQHLGGHVVVAVSPVLLGVQSGHVAALVTGAAQDELVVPGDVDPRDPFGIGAPAASRATIKTDEEETPSCVSASGAALSANDRANSEGPVTPGTSV